MKAEVRRRFQFAFVLTKSDLRLLHACFINRGLEPVISVECGSEVELHPESLEDLFRLVNAAPRIISKVTLASNAQSYPDKLVLSFSSSRLAPISLSIAAQNDLSVLLEQELVDLIKGTKQWYSPLAVVTPFSTALTGVAVVGFFGSLYITHLGQHPVIGLLMLAISYPLMFRQTAVQKVFPVAGFEIGKGEERILRAGKWREVAL